MLRVNEPLRNATDAHEGCGNLQRIRRQRVQRGVPTNQFAKTNNALRPPKMEIEQVDRKRKPRTPGGIRGSPLDTDNEVLATGTFL